MAAKGFAAQIRHGAVLAMALFALLAGSGGAMAAEDASRIDSLEARIAQLNADMRKISHGIGQIDQRMDRLDDMEIRLVRMARDLRELRREVQLAGDRAERNVTRVSPRPMLLPSSW
ncbi:MAG: hypothetical protein OEZ10_01420 [Gammaproteobacteria bacterium]|nr:hypothetical protein [Gammaproteobacteria bacterium]